MRDREICVCGHEGHWHQALVTPMGEGPDAARKIEQGEGRCEAHIPDSNPAAFCDCPGFRDPEPRRRDEFSLEIELGNAAMKTPDDVADALVQVAGRL